MKRSTLRIIIPVAVLAVVAIGYVTTAGIGTPSAFGWESISLICPLGALTTMLASKTLIPKALISLAVAFIAILLLGRAFCGWVCPVPLVTRLRTAFRKKQTKAHSETEGAEGASEPICAQNENAAANALKASAPGSTSSSQCATCPSTHSKVDSRYFVLSGSLLSAAIFGFPVFCLICPIGLTFATILLVLLLFTQGDITWSVVAVPLLLIVEVVLFRKWCAKICPLAALMNLVGKLNRTWQPRVNKNVCLEAKGAHCKKCTRVCAEGINLIDNNPENAPMETCTKCGACADACPTRAITLPFLPQKEKKSSEAAESSTGKRS